MPAAFYEVEHTTDIKNSLSKFFELQDFHANFFIVADEHRRAEYDEKLSASMFTPLVQRISFLAYDRVARMYEGMSKVSEAAW